MTTTTRAPSALHRRGAVVHDQTSRYRLAYLERFGCLPGRSVTTNPEDSTHDDEEDNPASIHRRW
jgi:hypothetical protein